MAFYVLQGSTVGQQFGVVAAGRLLADPMESAESVGLELLKCFSLPIF